MNIWKIVLYVLFIFMSGCASMNIAPEKYFSGKAKRNASVSLWMPLASARAKYAYNHTLNGFSKSRSDCTPNCPKVDIWQYQYRPDKKNTMTDSQPISTRKVYWKVKSEARIIAISMFNGRKLYSDGLSDYISSFKHLKSVNKIDEPVWGFETFTVRIYVAKRNPQRVLELGPMQDDTPDDMIEKFLQEGMEVAFVDNGLAQSGKDGTFWRFMVAAEEMPQGERIRYLVRDADATLTAGEAFSVGEWIASGLAFHRMHIIPVCFGPLTAMVFGGSHEGKGPLSDMKTRIEYFPYRMIYGDDELFTRDMIWPVLKAEGSVMTHHYPRGFVFKIANPYQGSCEEPTQAYCDEMRLGGTCPDVLMPNDIYSPLKALGLRGSFAELRENDAFFDLRSESPRGKAAIEALSGS